MTTTHETETAKRRPVNLTVREDILKEAKALDLNTSRAAEAGIIAAIREARGQAWLAQNKAAIKAHNKRLEEEGVSIKPYWAD